MKDKPKILIALFLLSIFLSVLVSCGRESIKSKLLKDMGGLDRAYIPVLFFSNLQRTREVEIALKEFKSKWDGFYQKYYTLEMKYGVNIVDKFWKDDFDRVKEVAKNAEKEVARGSLILAYENIDEIRVVLRDLRYRNNVDYFVDRLTEFYKPLEKMILMVQNKARLTQTEERTIGEYYSELKRKWLEVRRAKIEPKIFRLSDKQVSAVKEKMRRVSVSLAEIDTAVASHDPAQILSASNRLSEDFAALYRAFGDFEYVFNKVREERGKNQVQPEKKSCLSKGNNIGKEIARNEKKGKRKH